MTNESKMVADSRTKAALYPPNRPAPGPRDGSRRVALIAGASGHTGRRLAEHLAASEHWEVVGVSRRPSANPKGYKVISADLTDAQSCRTAFKDLGHITDVIYCARYDHTEFVTEAEDTNFVMFRNFVDAIEPVARGLQHIHQMQGTKYYGSELGPFKTPAKETDPRVLSKFYYYQQEDYIRERSRGKSWSWSSSLPHSICDYEPGFARSIPMVIAVYAAICKEMGLQLCFPGSPANFNVLYQVTEATLLANAVAWMATEPKCAGEKFNVTNGDYLRWTNLWPTFAKFFEMEPGPIHTVKLAEMMANRGPVWDRIVSKHNLKPTPFEKAALWSYGDFVFAPYYDTMSDTRKLREFGFMETMDTEKMFLGIWTYLRQEKIIP